MIDSTIQEWQHIARDLGADDCATDRYDEDEDANDWAERVYGPAARAFVLMHDSLMTRRFGPETAPQQPPAAKVRDAQYSPEWLRQAAVNEGRTPEPETSEQFARQLQALALDPELAKDFDIRNEQIVELAIRFAGQFLFGGVQFASRPVLGVEA